MPLHYAPSNFTALVRCASRCQLSVQATLRLHTSLTRAKAVPQALVRGASIAQHDADLLACERRYRTTAEEDEATITSSTAGPRQKVAARLLRIEKEILHGALADLFHAACVPCKTGALAHSVKIDTWAKA